VAGVSGSHLIITIVMSFLPWTLMGYSYFSHPSYLRPLFAWPVGFILLLLMLIWSIIGFFVMLRAKSRLGSYTAVTVFVFPLILVVMIGPAFLPIFQSLKSVFE
jgi:hypothetical protein